MNFQRWRRLALCTLVVATPGLVHGDTVALQPSTSLAESSLYPYDGEWTGEMRTTFSSGPCGTRYRLEMSVTQGAATGSASRTGERFTLYGTIDADGKLTWTATGGRGSVTGDGLVDGGTAQGDWEDDSGRCTGTFSIDKK